MADTPAWHAIEQIREALAPHHTWHNYEDGRELPEGRTCRACDALAALGLLTAALEAAEGACKFARQVDLDAAVVQGGYPDLRAALVRVRTGQTP